jgi:DedD protein
MANMDTLTSEEMDLRRRARRRLVGAVALALLAVVVLPMLFNPEPKPLGPGVDIRIPDQSTPFEPRMPAPDTEPPTVGVDPPPPTPLGQTSVEAPPVVSAPVVSPAPSVAPPVTPPRQTPAASSAAKPVVQAGTSAGTQSAPDKAPATEVFAARGYFLQLGAFTNEANARQLADKAKAAGFDVVVQEVGGQVRVRMGPYAERRQALEMQAKLRAKGFGPILLGP